MKLDCELEEIIEDYFRVTGKVKLDGFISYHYSFINNKVVYTPSSETAVKYDKKLKRKCCY